MRLGPLVDGPPVALALGGGAARGIAHIGILKVLAQRGIRVGAVAGTSVGSLIGAAFCAGYSWEEILAAARRVRWGDLARFTIPRRGLMRLDGLQRLVEHLLGKRNIEDLPIPFAAVATELPKGEEVVFRKGPLASAIVASCSIPGIFEPALIDGHCLVDGGLVADVPAAPARRLLPGPVIAVCLNAASPEVGVPCTMVDVLSQSFGVFLRNTAARGLVEADIVVAPDLESFGYTDLGRIDELVAAGEAAATRVFAEKRIPAWRWLRWRAG